MYLSKRHGIYYLWFVDQRGKKKKVSTGTRSRSEALEFLTHFSLTTAKRSPILLFKEFKEKVLEYVKVNYAPGTYLIYRDSLKRLENIIGDIAIDEITPFHFDQFKSKRLGENVSPETVNIGLRNIKAAMGFAKRWKLLDTNPFSCLSMAHVPERAPMFFSKDEFQKLYLEIDRDWFREIVVFALLTGMREGEIINLRWFDVDLRNGFVKVECSPNFKTKAGKRRTLPLNKAAMTMLLNKQQINPESLVFTLKGNKIDKYWINHLFRRYREKAGLTRPLTFHSVRHTFASWLALDGVSIYQISKLLGHSDVAVTQHYYAHLQPSELRDAVNKISFQLNA